MLIYRAKLKSENLKGRAYLEGWCRMLSGGEFFSKGLDNPATGTTDWASYETPFFLKQGEHADLIKLNLVIEGKGTIWIKDVEVLRGPLPPSPLERAVAAGREPLQERTALGGEANAEEAQKKALDAAGPWLALMDQGQYEQGWEAAAQYLKNAVSKEDFAKSLAAVRKPLGSVTSRQLKSKEYRTDLPGAPAGQYVVLQYETSFENKKSAVETLTPMLDKDGKWRVSGYFIK
jgi:hypothetical protein